MFNLFGKKEKSASIASNRLKVVITQDRASISNEVLEDLKKDVLSVFNKYLIIDENGLECMVKKEQERNVGLSISIPVKKVKKRVNVLDED
jgi:cell division topological specificity factor